MTPPVQAALQSWSLPIPVTLTIVVAAFFYWRGWFHLYSARVHMLPAWRAVGFSLGLLSIWTALGSPLSAFDEQLLTVHMIQHLLLMTIAPPLILLGAPLMPFLHGLPRPFVRTVVGPILRWPPLQSVGRFLSHPAVGWIAAAAALVGWHVPAAFTLALQSEAWHVVEHSCFLASGFLFWWPVIQPWPSASSPARFTRACAAVNSAGILESVSSANLTPTLDPTGVTNTGDAAEYGGAAGDSRWPILLYLFLATIPCDILSAFLAFSGRVIYPIYLTTPRLFGLSTLADQECAAALMWTCVTVVYLIPAMIITVQLLGVHHAQEAK
jgi:putative membrane protein